MASEAYEKFRLAVALDCGWVAGELAWEKNSPCDVERWVWNRLRTLEREIDKRLAYEQPWREFEFDGVDSFFADSLFLGPGQAAGAVIGWSLCGREVRRRPMLDEFEPSMWGR